MRKLSTLFLGILVSFVWPLTSQAQILYGLTTDNKLVSFDIETAATLATNVNITGVAAGQAIVGLDVRPATGEVFILGYNSSNDSARLYVVNPTTGVATPKPNGMVLAGLGTEVGFDFNPTVDRIRVVSRTGKNFRLNPVSGALAATDQNLAYATGDVNQGQTPAVTACAYTNNYIGATTTQLYVYDQNKQIFAFQNPPNDGLLNTQAPFSGLSAGAVVSDIDIYTNPTTLNVTTFAAVRTNGKDSLYVVSIPNGGFFKIGAIGAPVIDIAAAINRTLPALQGPLAYGLTMSGTTFNFIQFDTKNPRFIRSAQPITGLKAGQMLVGMDMRPQDMKLYVLGYRAADSSATIYTINDTTAALSVYPGGDSLKLALGAGPVSFDFNPVANRLRIIGAETSKNYRLNLTVSPVSVITDTTLTYKVGDVNAGKSPFVVTAAYTGSFNGSTATQLYDIDGRLNILTNQNTANGGFLNTLGNIGLTFDRDDLSVDMDIYSTRSPASDMVFLAATTPQYPAFDKLYTLNLGTGNATEVGLIGLGLSVRNIAVKLEPMPTTTPTQDIAANIATSVFPNPAYDYVVVEAEIVAASPVQIIVTDMQGKRVYQYQAKIQGGLFAHTISTENWVSGTYILSVTTEEGRAIKRIIKCH